MNRLLVGIMSLAIVCIAGSCTDEDEYTQGQWMKKASYNGVYRAYASGFTIGNYGCLGVFHLDNEVTWQKTSNETVLPLPQLSLYHNFYILAKLAKKVLTVQLGADVRYFTKYNAPAYAPGVQQFHLQPTDDLVEIGGYPIVNVYANLHLKRTRIFAMMYHVNAGMGSANSFLVPHYPINPRLFKIGVSWNFYD